MELSDYQPAVEELGALIPELAGQERLDALIALGHATLWTEDEVATIATAAQAEPLVEEVGDKSARRGGARDGKPGAGDARRRG